MARLKPPPGAAEGTGHGGSGLRASTADPGAERGAQLGRGARGSDTVAGVLL